MPRKRHTAEQVIGKLREAEVSLSGGQTVPAVCRTLGISEQTYYRWRKEYGGLKIEQARRFKDLERENLRSFEALAHEPGSPGRVFVLDENALADLLLKIEEANRGSAGYRRWASAISSAS